MPGRLGANGAAELGVAVASWLAKTTIFEFRRGTQVFSRDFLIRQMQLGGGTHEALKNDVLKLVAARGKGVQPQKV